MAQEVGMRRYRYILPPLVALLSVLCSFLTVKWREAQIIDMINDAGRKNEPIVVCNTFMGDSVLVTFGHDPVRLATKSFTWPGLQPFVSDSGVISFLDISPNSDYMRHTPRMRRIELPKVFAGEPIIVEYPPEIGQDDRLCVTRDPKNVVCDDEGYVILSLPDLAVTRGKFKSPPLWLGVPDASSPFCVVSADGNVIIARVFSWTTSAAGIWSYDIGAGVWHKIIDDLGPGHPSVGPDGKIMAYELSESTKKPSKIQFINTSDGTVMHEVFQAKWSIIGERWIACMEKHATGVILVDMANGWTERRIPLPRHAENEYTIWVPPPGGYAEMMSLREGVSVSATDDEARLMRDSNAASNGGV